MKKIFLSLSLLLVLGLTFFWFANNDKQLEASTHLPWQVHTNADGTTHVLEVDIGKVTFKQLMFKLRYLAEPAIFETPEGKLTLEAYFGKKKFGMLEARLIAEMDGSQEFLKTMLIGSTDKKATPSNNWKYALNLKNTKIANDQRVWRLIYLPITDYELKQMQFFGEPEEKLKVNATAEYWIYPSKGVALLYDTAGKEIFYYVAPRDFSRLRDSLPKKEVMIIK